MSLRELLSRLASASASAKMSSGIETAIFIPKVLPRFPALIKQVSRAGRFRQEILLGGPGSVSGRACRLNYLIGGAAIILALGQLAVLWPAMRAASGPPAVVTRIT